MRDICLFYFAFLSQARGVKLCAIDRIIGWIIAPPLAVFDGVTGAKIVSLTTREYAMPSVFLPKSDTK